MGSILFSRRAARVLNVLDVFGIAFILVMAFAFQIIMKDLPCPLCLLQRFGFLAMGFGSALNLLYGFRASHYALSIVASIYTAFVALRQIALHVVPGTGGYGPEFLGLHLYTWVFIIANLAVLYLCFVMSFAEQYQRHVRVNGHNGFLRKLGKVGIGLLFILVLLNALGVYFECGFGQCPENPTSYIH